MEKYYAHSEKYVAGLARYLRAQGKAVELIQINDSLWVIKVNQKRSAFFVA